MNHPKEEPKTLFQKIQQAHHLYQEAMATADPSRKFLDQLGTLLEELSQGQDFPQGLPDMIAVIQPTPDGKVAVGFQSRTVTCDEVGVAGAPSQTGFLLLMRSEGSRRVLFVSNEPLGEDAVRFIADLGKTEIVH